MLMLFFNIAFDFLFILKIKKILFLTKGELSWNSKKDMIKEEYMVLNQNLKLRR